MLPDSFLCRYQRMDYKRNSCVWRGILRRDWLLRNEPFQTWNWVLPSFWAQQNHDGLLQKNGNKKLEVSLQEEGPFVNEESWFPMEEIQEASGFLFLDQKRLKCSICQCYGHLSREFWLWDQVTWILTCRCFRRGPFMRNYTPDISHRYQKCPCLKESPFPKYRRTIMGPFPYHFVSC